MQVFATITDARKGLAKFDRQSYDDIPEHLVDRYSTLAASPSPVDQIVGVAEFFYANRDQLTAPMWDLGGALTQYATTNAWHGLYEDDRGNKIVANFRKLLGEIQSAPAAPDALPGYRIEPPAAEGAG